MLFASQFPWSRQPECMSHRVAAMDRTTVPAKPSVSYEELGLTMLDQASLPQYFWQVEPANYLPSAPPAEQEVCVDAQEFKGNTSSKRESGKRKVKKCVPSKLHRFSRLTCHAVIRCSGSLVPNCLSLLSLDPPAAKKPRASKKSPPSKQLPKRGSKKCIPPKNPQVSACKTVKGATKLSGGDLSSLFARLDALLQALQSLCHAFERCKPPPSDITM